MMKIKAFVSLLLIFCLLFTGCAVRDVTSVNPIKFYYCREEAQYHTQTGALDYEQRELGKEDITISEILKLYFQGPQSQIMCSPFPSGTACEQTLSADGILTLHMNSAFDALNGIERTTAAACLTMTLCQISGVQGVRIVADDENAVQPDLSVLRPDDFLLYDESARYPQITATLYFLEEQTGNLRAEKRKLMYQQRAQLPQLVMQELLEGPTLYGMESAVPKGTQCLDIQLINGLCTVVLSSAFSNCDTNEETARAAVYAVVATLCSLDEISQVQILLEDGAELVHCSIEQALTMPEDWNE